MRLTNLLTRLCSTLVLACSCVCTTQANDKILTLGTVPSGWSKQGNRVSVSHSSWMAYQQSIGYGKLLTIDGSIQQLTITDGSGKSLLKDGIGIVCHSELSFTGGHVTFKTASVFHKSLQSTALTISNTNNNSGTFYGTVTLSGTALLEQPAVFHNTLHAGSLTVSNNNGNRATFKGAVEILGHVNILQWTVFEKSFQAKGDLLIANNNGNSAMFVQDAFVSGRISANGELTFKKNLVAKEVTITGKDASTSICASLHNKGVLSANKITFANSSLTWQTFSVVVQGSTLKIYDDKGKETTLKAMGLEGNLCLQQLSQSLLPIYLQQFSAQRKAQGVLLSWQTDRPFYYRCQIERSDDGIIFLPLAEVQGVQHYTDEQAPARQLSYRLRLQLPDDKYLYSTPVQVAAANHDNLLLQVAPNPITGNRLQLQLQAAPWAQVSLQLFDMQGRLLLQHTVRMDGSGQGQWSAAIPAHSGMMLLQATDGQRTQTVKVLAH